jgi:hypothetical protein
VSGGLLAVVWALVVLHLVSGMPFFRTAAVGLLAVFLLCAVPHASMHIRLVFAVGVAAAAWSVLGAGDWTPVLRGLEAGVIIGAFFPTILLLRATADQSPLLGATRESIARLDERRQQAWVQAVAHLLGSFLMIGSYVIARSALPRALPEEQRVRLAQSAMFGLGLASCWSPFFLNGAIASQLVPSVRAWQLVLLGLAFATVGWLLSKLLFYRGTPMLSVLPNVAAFAMPSAILVSIVIAVSLLTGLKSLEAIVLVMPLMCLAYLARRGWPAMKRALVRVPPSLGRLSDEIIVFTITLMVGTVVAGSGAGKGLSTILAGLASAPLLMITAEVALIVGLGYVGIHPMITATLMFPLLAEAHRALADVVAAYILVLGWGMSAMVAIWQIPIAAAATTFEVPIGRLAFGRNLHFVAIYGVCGCLMLAFINRFLA